MHQHPQRINFELFLVVENHCVFVAHIFWNCAFFPVMCVKNAKRRPKIITGCKCYQKQYVLENNMT